MRHKRARCSKQVNRTLCTYVLSITMPMRVHDLGSTWSTVFFPLSHVSFRLRHDVLASTSQSIRNIHSTWQNIAIFHSIPIHKKAKWRKWQSQQRQIPIQLKASIFGSIWSIFEIHCFESVFQISIHLHSCVPDVTESVCVGWVFVCVCAMRRKAANDGGTAARTHSHTACTQYATTTHTSRTVKRSSCSGAQNIRLLVLVRAVAVRLSWHCCCYYYYGCFCSLSTVSACHIAFQ